MHRSVEEGLIREDRFNVFFTECTHAFFCKDASFELFRCTIEYILLHYFIGMTSGMNGERKVKATTRSVATMGDLLLKGYCMLAESCPDCMVRSS